MAEQDWKGTVGGKDPATFVTSDDPANVTKQQAGITIDGGGSAITPGLKGLLPISYDATLLSWSLVADQAGSIVVDVWKAAGAVPTESDSVTAAAPPTLTSEQLADDATLTGWDTVIAAGDVLGFNVVSCDTCTRVTLALSLQK